VSELKALGVEGLASYKLLPDSEKLSRESVAAAIKGRNIDAVLVTHLLGIDEREAYVQGNYQSYPMRHGHRRGYGAYYSSVYDTLYTPGYYVKFKVVRLETNVYETNNAVMVWSMQSETLDPESVTQLTESLVREVSRKLKENGLI
jgi:hypothetical protein